jgi:hypothetical protein
MKWQIVCLFLGVAMASAAYFPEKFPVTKKEHGVAMDKTVLEKQKFFFDIFRNIHQPIIFKEYFPIPTTFNMDKSYYTVSTPRSLFRFVCPLTRFSTPGLPIHSGLHQNVRHGNNIAQGQDLFDLQ